MTSDRSRERSVASGTERFYCKNRQAEVSMMYCLDNYVDVNALNVKDSQCFRCTQGSRVRADFSAS